MEPRQPEPSAALPPAPGSAFPSGGPPAGGWSVRAGHGATWWSDGWRLFTVAPWLWIAMMIVFVAMMMILTVVPVIGTIASTLLYPVLGAGLLVGARDVDGGKPLRFGHLFACFDQ